MQHTVEKDFSLIELFNPLLQKIDQIVFSNTESRHELIHKISKHIFQPCGKKIRPVLTLSAFHFFKNGLCPAEDEQVKYALYLGGAVECIHSATLLHDDVVDESLLRRGIEAAHRIWGNKAAILVGDFLFAESFRLMVKQPKMEVLAILARAASIITEGEVKQLSLHGLLTLSIDDYMDIIQSKTATLFGASAQVGALTADALPDQAQDFFDCARYFGMAYQIRDDILDYDLAGSHNTKNKGDDFFEGKVTLPLLLYYQSCSQKEQSYLEEIFSMEVRLPEDFEKIRGKMVETNIYEACHTLSLQFLDKAMEKMSNYQSHWLYQPFKNHLFSFFKK